MKNSPSKGTSGSFYDAYDVDCKGRELQYRITIDSYRYRNLPLESALVSSEHLNFPNPAAGPFSEFGSH